MARPMSDELQRLQEDVARRQYARGRPRAIRETLSTLLARRGCADVAGAAEREQAWGQVVGPALAACTRVGMVRRGVLEIVVSNSAALQELTLQKRQLLQGMAAALPDQPLRDLRFRVGTTA